MIVRDKKGRIKGVVPVLGINAKPLFNDSKMPAKFHEWDAGWDLYAHNHTVDENGVHTYGTGIALEIPIGYVGFVFPRSSVYKTGMVMCNSVGVIDAQYIGEISCKFIPVSQNYTPYEVGDRIGQVVVMPCPKVEINLVEDFTDELSDSDRGTGGYGSTGK